VRMAVNRAQFESIVGNLLNQKPSTRKEQRTGTKKVKRIIPPKTVPSQSASVPESESDKAAEKSEPS
jgi:hypothetical protein